MMPDCDPNVPLQFFLVQETTDENLKLLLDYINQNTKEALMAQLELAQTTKSLGPREEDDPLVRPGMRSQLSCMRLALQQRDAQ
jgi:hypothetical protein